MLNEAALPTGNIPPGIKTGGNQKVDALQKVLHFLKWYFNHGCCFNVLFHEIDE